MAFHRKNLSGLASLLCLVTSPMAFATDTEQLIENPAYTHAQQRVEVAPGRKLNLYCVGKGSPTVIFEAGMGDEAGTWGLVQPAIAAHTRACSYERAGLGFSDPADRPGTAANAVDDLHHLLAAANIKPPYVLVGHSYGGMVVRLYTDLYPKDLVGMVLVDAQEEDWPQTFWRLDPQQQPWQKMWEENYSDHSTSVQEGQKCVDAARAKTLTKGTPLYAQCVPGPLPKFGKAMGEAYVKVHEALPFQLASLSEQANAYGASADQIRAARRWYGDMPLIVMVPTYQTIMPKNVPPDETQAHWEKETHAIMAMHDAWAALSRKGEVRQVDNTGHYIQLRQPGAVTKAVLDVLAQPAPAAGP